MGVQVNLTDGFVNLDHSPFRKSLDFIKSLPDREWQGGTAKYWQVPMAKNDFLTLASKNGVWDYSLAEEQKNEAHADNDDVFDESEGVTLKSWLAGFRISLQLRHKINLSDFEIDSDVLALGFENGWNVNEAADQLVEAGIFA